MVQGNPRVYKALREQLAAVLDELRRIEAGQGVSDELLDTIQMIATIMDGMQEDICLWELTQKKRPPETHLLAQMQRQPIQKGSDNSIPASEAKGNGEMDDLEEMYRKMQRMADPRYLHTLTMTELFQTAYKSRPPIIENLLHSGSVPPRGRAQDRQVVPGGADRLPCQHRAGAVGVQSPSGNRPLPRVGG